MIGYYLLEAFAPDPPTWVTVLMVAGLPGLVALAANPIVWFFKSPEGRERMRFPPLRRLATAGFVMALVATGASNLGAGFGAILFFPFTIFFTGTATTFWYLSRPFRRMSSISTATDVEVPAAPPVTVSSGQSQSERDACDACRAASQNAMGDPLVRVGHTSDGPKFLYRCSRCHSYWLREMTQTTVISVMRAKHLFPESVVA